MKKQSLEILHRYRSHLLEKEQIALQDKIAEESQQKMRVFQLQARIQATHNAKLRAGSVDTMRSLEEAASYLQGRLTMAKRALSLSGSAREESLQKTLKAKQERDQVGSLLEKGRSRQQARQAHSERNMLDEIVTSRYAMTLGGA